MPGSLLSGASRLFATKYLTRVGRRWDPFGMHAPLRRARSAVSLGDREPRRVARLTRIPGSAADALDHVIHERARLGIVSALAVAPSMTFVELKAALGLTDGNLSVHARRLEDTGYVACEKRFDGRIPRTEYRLTPKGRAALARYLDRMEALIRTTRAGRGG